MSIPSQPDDSPPAERRRQGPAPSGEVPGVRWTRRRGLVQDLAVYVLTVLLVVALLALVAELVRLSSGG